MGFREKTAESEQKSAEQLIQQELKKEFSPEFINRIDDIIIFNPLSQTELRQICRLLVDDVNQALIHRNVQISIDDSVVDWLLKKAEEEANSGARPLRRVEGVVDPALLGQGQDRAPRQGGNGDARHDRRDAVA